MSPYTNDQLKAAIKAVKDKVLSQRGSARAFGIPYTTLGEKIRGRRAEKKGGESKTPLSPQEEERICQWLIEMSKRGMGRSKQQLLATVKTILDCENRRTIFLNNQPGRTWYYAFKKRHPELSLRAPQQLGIYRASVSKEAVSRWFHDFKTTLVELDSTILMEPDRLFNADESGFSLCPKTGKVLAQRGARHIYSLSHSARQMITCLACVSASSRVLPPLLVFPGKHFHYNPLKGFKEAHFSSSDKGWINGAIFSQWIKDIFIPSTRDIKKPVLLLIDGHASHVTLEASKLCKDNNIILYGLLSHATHLMQPLDVVFFSSLKKQWSKAVSEFIGQQLEMISKQTFAAVFKKAWTNTAAIENIGGKSFQKAGIFPLDISAIHIDKTYINNIMETDITHANPHPTPAITAQSPPISTIPAPTSPTPSTSASIFTKTPVQPSAAITRSTPTTMLPTQTHHTLDLLLQTTEECVGEHGAGGVQLFLTRYREGFNMQHDQCYNEWKVLYEKVLSASREKQLSHSGSNSDAFQKHLKLPEGWKKRTTKRKFEPTPFLLSGTRYQDILEEKRRKKEEEEVRKEKRKIEREEKRKQKELEKERKMKEREEKKKLAEAKKLLRGGAKRVQKKDESESDCSDFSLYDNAAENVCVPVPFYSDVCAGCGNARECDRWLKCEVCERWWHVFCVSYMCLNELSEEELERLEFICDVCM